MEERGERKKWFSSPIHFSSRNTKQVQKISPLTKRLQTDGFCSLVPGAPQFPRTDLNRMKSADFGTIWSPFSYQKFSPPL